MSTIKGWAYGKLMRLAHRHGWHHTITHYVEGDVHIWCQWCGLREVRRRDHFMGHKIVVDDRMPKDAVYFFNLADYATKEQKPEESS